MTNITEICLLLVELITVICGIFVIPYIKSKLDVARLEKLITYAQIGVQAAEALFKESGLGEKKKEYVINYLKSLGYDLDIAQLEAVIESAVLELKAALLE